MSLNQEEEEYIERLYREMYTRLCIYAMSALGSKALKKLYKILFELRVLSQMD